MSNKLHAKGPLPPLMLKSVLATVNSDNAGGGGGGDDDDDDDPLVRYRAEKERESRAAAEQFAQYQASLRLRPRISASVTTPDDPVRAYMDAHGQNRSRSLPPPEEEEQPPPQLNTEEQRELARRVEKWKHDRYVLEKCRANLQQAKLNHRESETQLKQVLHSPLLVNIRADGDSGDSGDSGDNNGRPKLILVSEIERKKALTVQTLRMLLRKELGERQGDQLFQTLMENRGTKREQVLQCRRAPKKTKIGDLASFSAATGDATVEQRE